MPRTEFKNGIEVPKFDHENGDVHLAIGYNHDDLYRLGVRLIDTLKRWEATHGRHPKTSEQIEVIYNEFNKLDAMLLMYMLSEYQEWARERDETASLARIARVAKCAF